MAAAAIVKINRAPVLTLWAAVVARRLGFDANEALSFGRAVAGLNAHSKGVSLGLFEPTTPEAVREHRRQQRRGTTRVVSLLGRTVPATRTPDGLRAVSGGRPIAPASVQKYLEVKFGEDLGRVQARMEKLALAMPPRELAAHAYRLYEAFRPDVPAGVRGWGAVGELDLGRIRPSKGA